VTVNNGANLAKDYFKCYQKWLEKRVLMFKGIEVSSNRVLS